MPTILIVEDQRDLAAGLKDNCEYEGYEALTAFDGDEGLRVALERRPDLILLDIMLPKRNGFDLCREIRAAGVGAPVLMLSARGVEADKVLGLELGADDYITKPFSMRELSARIRAHLRRSAKDPGSPVYTFGDVKLDFRSHRATKRDRPIAMTRREFSLLKHLIARRGEVISREQLLNEIWGLECYPLTRTVDNHIAKLRQKIERDPAAPEWLITVHGVGYKFVG
jgi:two-component system alkaline phosphatase synthesis response regulator PhoP